MTDSDDDDDDIEDELMDVEMAAIQENNSYREQQKQQDDDGKKQLTPPYSLQPHFPVTLKSTREVMGFNLLGDALHRLDFVNAVRDVRR